MLIRTKLLLLLAGIPPSLLLVLGITTIVSSRSPLPATGATRER